MSIGKTFAKAALLAATAMTPAMAEDVKVPEVKDMTIADYAKPTTSANARVDLFDDVRETYGHDLFINPLTREQARCVGDNEASIDRENYMHYALLTASEDPEKAHKSSKEAVKRMWNYFCPPPVYVNE